MSTRLSDKVMSTLEREIGPLVLEYRTGDFGPGGKVLGRFRCHLEIKGNEIFFNEGLDDFHVDWEDAKKGVRACIIDKDGDVLIEQMCIFPGGIDYESVMV